MSTRLSVLCENICKGFADVRDLESAPENEWTNELAARMCDSISYSVRYMPKFVLSPEICRTAVYRDSKMFEFIPNEFRTYGIYKHALRTLKSNIKHVPVEMLTAEFCEDIFGRDLAFSTSLEFASRMPQTELMKLMPILINKYRKDILCTLTVQPKEICLLSYQLARWSYPSIRSDKRRRFVVRVAMSDIVVAMRAAGLSTNLLVEMFEQMGTALYPTPNRSGCPLSPVQIWSIVAAANHYDTEVFEPHNHDTEVFEPHNHDTEVF